MNIKKLNEEIEKFLLHELTYDQAGERLEFNNFEDAINQLKIKYEKGEIRAYCDSVDTFEYNGKIYSLCLVLGISKPFENMKGYGMKHYLDKHKKDLKQDKSFTSIEDLIKATKNIKTAYNNAKKKKEIAFNYKKHRIVFKNRSYVYVICLAKDVNEITYLHSLFPTTDKNYIKKKKKEYNNQF